MISVGLNYFSAGALFMTALYQGAQGKWAHVAISVVLCALNIWAARAGEARGR